MARMIGRSTRRFQNAGVCGCALALAVALPAGAAAQTRATGAALGASSRPTPGQSDRGSSGDVTPLTASRVFPVFDGLDSGAGITAGVGVRRKAGPGVFEFRYAASHRGYVGSSVEWIRPALGPGGAAELRLGARYRESPQMSFYGIGDRTDGVSRTSYELRRVDVGADLRVRLSPRWSVDGSAGMVWFGTENGDGPFPSIDTRFTAGQVPGLLTSPSFVRAAVGVELDTQDADVFPNTGGSVRASVEQWRPIDGQSFAFTRTDVGATRHIPLFHGTSSLTLRGQVSITATDDDDLVPHFLLPSLGGSSTLRGYRNFRFQDRHSLLLSAEYRVRPASRLELSFFVDSGRVAHRLSELTLTGLHTSVGLGTRIRGPRGTSLNFGVARGAEGFRYLVSFGSRF